MKIAISKDATTFHIMWEGSEWNHVFMTLAASIGSKHSLARQASSTTYLRHAALPRRHCAIIKTLTPSFSINHSLRPRLITDTDRQHVPHIVISIQKAMLKR
eukprot:scpid103547/ scgid15444/ 